MATDAQDLHTGTPLWAAYGLPRIATRRLRKDTDADIVVIGAGITGAMAAQALSAEGFRVVMLDKRAPMHGATFATTALLQYEIDQPLTKLTQQIGRDDAARAWQASKLGLESLVATLHALGIRCQMARCPSLYLAGNVLDAKGLASEAKARCSIGLPSEYLTRSALIARYGIHKSAALLTQQNLTVNPLHMTAGFLRDALGRGMQLYAPIEVAAIESSARHVTVHTVQGPSIKARYAIHATGYEMPKTIRTKRHSIHSTYAIATRPQPNTTWPQACMVWEASDPYLYIRRTADGRIICGGEDEDFEDEDKRDALIAKKQARLEKKLQHLFPQVDARAQFAWAGSFGSSTTGLPTIGNIPGMARCYAIMAFGGNGITFSKIAADLIAAELSGRTYPDAGLFAFA